MSVMCVKRKRERERGKCMKGETARRQLLKERDGISGHPFTWAAAWLLAEQYGHGVRVNWCPKFV